MKLREKSQIRLLTVCSLLIYFSSYITRINYSAVLVEFVAAEGVAKSDAALITSVLFVTYGCGQLLSGFLGDRVSARLLIFAGLLVAAICNFLMPLLAPNIGAMAVIWGVNGLAQAFMWPPLVKILTSALAPEDYGRIVPGVCASAAVATIAVYLLSPALIDLSGWKTVFAVSGCAALAVTLFWVFKSRKLLASVDFTVQRIEKKTMVGNSDDRQMWKLLPVILLTIAIQGMLRDGINTWMPTFLTETFRVESTVSIFSSVALPIMHILVSLTNYRVLRAMKGNTFESIVLYFSLVVGLLLGLRILGMNSMVVSVVLLALVSGAVNGINGMQTCYLPAAFSNTGNVSFLAGLLNSATYVGSAVSTYLFAVISENWGWGSTVASWIAFAALGLGLTLICMKKKGLKDRSVVL